MRDRIRHLLLGVFAVACLAAVTWPGYALLGDRVRPHVLGLPFVFFWNLLWVGLSFVALLAYHATGRKG